MARDSVQIPLLVGGREAGRLEFAITQRETGAGHVLQLELEGEDLRAELDELLKPGNPQGVRVRSIVPAEAATSLDGVIAALGTLAERHHKGAGAFTYDASEAQGKFGTLWDEPGVVV